MSSNINVTVRVRPLDEERKEKWAAGFELSGTRRISLGTKIYDPDAVLDTKATQQDAFRNVKHVVESVINGGNGTIFVYGQTGTGKTHTMFGHECNNNDGVAFQSISYLVDHVNRRSPENSRISLTISMLELYNERLTDMISKRDVELLNGTPRKCTSAQIVNLDNAVEYIKKCLGERQVAATAMNDRSSRSHVIVQADLSEVLDDDTTRTGRLCLVDLAGSESLKKSKAEGKQAAEAGMINKSLLALKNVIVALSESSTTPAHVPYRDSKLTDLLRDSIGGSATTSMIACISPNGRDIEETKSTLDYSSKARQIKNVLNTEREKLQIKVRSMEVEIQRLKNKLQQQSGHYITREEHEENVQRVEQLAKAEDDLEKLMAERQETIARSNVAKGEVEILRQKIRTLEGVVGGLQQEKNDFLKHVNAAVATTQKRYRCAISSIHETAVRDQRSMSTAVTEVTPATKLESLATELSDRADAMITDMRDAACEAIASLKTSFGTHISRHVALQKSNNAALLSHVQAALTKNSSPLEDLEREIVYECDAAESHTKVALNKSLNLSQVVFAAENEKRELLRDVGEMVPSHLSAEVETLFTDASRISLPTFRSLVVEKTATKDSIYYDDQTVAPVVLEKPPMVDALSASTRNGNTPAAETPVKSRAPAVASSPVNLRPYPSTRSDVVKAGTKRSRSAGGKANVNTRRRPLKTSTNFA